MKLKDRELAIELQDDAERELSEQNARNLNCKWVARGTQVLACDENGRCEPDYGDPIAYMADVDDIKHKDMIAVIAKYAYDERITHFTFEGDCAYIDNDDETEEETPTGDSWFHVDVTREELVEYLEECDPVRALTACKMQQRHLLQTIVQLQSKLVEEREASDKALNAMRETIEQQREELEQESRERADAQVVLGDLADALKRAAKITEQE
jgi:hypothetical protein